jgi:hypothetical protein
MPTIEEIYRTCAGHAVDLALKTEIDPKFILEMAQYHFEQMLGADAEWPERRLLH